MTASSSKFWEAFFCGNDTVAVAMCFAMKNGQICFSLRKFLAILSAIQKSLSDCSCDAVVHLVPNVATLTTSALSSQLPRSLQMLLRRSFWAHSSPPEFKKEEQQEEEEAAEETARQQDSTVES